MNHFITFTLAAAIGLSNVANAAITAVVLPGSPSPDGSDFLWSYMISVDNQEELVSGNWTTCADGSPCGTFFSIYDFAGYVSGSITAPTGWTASAQLTGLTASNQSPMDDPTVTNLTFAYVGPPSITVGPIAGLVGFSAESVYGTINLDGAFTYQAQKIDNSTAPDAGIGPIDVPSAPVGVPEPAPLTLMGSGLVGFAFLRRTFARPVSLNLAGLRKD